MLTNKTKSYEVLLQELKELKNKIKILETEKEEQQNIQNKISTFYPLLKWNNDSKIHKWGNNLVSKLAEELKAAYIELFLIESEYQKKELKSIAKYGSLTEDLTDNEYLKKLLKYYKQEFIILGENKNIFIETSAGEIILEELKIIPLLFNDELEGCIVVGFVSSPPKCTTKLLNGLIPLLAATLNTIKQQLFIKRLWEESQTKNEMLASQEEELRQNLEELEATQEQLRQQQSLIQKQWTLLNTVVNAVEAPIVSIDNAGLVTSFNLAAERYFKKNLKINLYVNAPLLMELEMKKSSLLPFFRRALRGHTLKTMQENSKFQKYYEIVINPVKAENGNIEGACFFAQDISELKHSQIELEENKKRIEYLVNNLPGISYIAEIINERDWKIHFISKQIKEYIGIEPEDLTQRHLFFSNIIHHDDIDKINKLIQNNPSQIELEHRIITSDNKIKWVYHKGQISQKAGNKFIDGFMLDITEKVHLQQNLEKEVAARTKELRETLMELESIKDQLIHSEKMAVLGQMFAGISHEIKTPISAVISSADNLYEQFKPIIKNFPQAVRKINDKLPLLEKFLNELLANQKFLSSKEARKLRKKLISQLEKNNIQNADLIARRIISAGFTSENIEEFIPLFQENLGKDVSEIAFLIGQHNLNIENIKTAGTKIQKILNAIKKYSHSNATSEKVKTNIIETIETILILYHNQLKYNIELETNFEEVPEIMANPDELGQIWTNLITNALDAMNYEGKLIINVKNLPEEILVEIIDSGKGIPKEIQNKIFTPFFTTKKRGKGTGLGLHLCKQIVQKHQGRMEVESKPGRTAFKVYLPKNLK